MNEVREVKDKNYLLEKEVLFGDMKKLLIKNFNKFSFVIGQIFLIVFLVLFIVVNMVSFSIVSNYMDIKNNMFW